MEKKKRLASELLALYWGPVNPETRTFLPLPVDVIGAFGHLKMGAAEIRVFLGVASRVHRKKPNDPVKVSHAWLAKIAGVVRSNVPRLLRSLEDRGLIRRVHKGIAYSPSRYELLWRTTDALFKHPLLIEENDAFFDQVPDHPQNDRGKQPG